MVVGRHNWSLVLAAVLAPCSHHGFEIPTTDVTQQQRRKTSNSRFSIRSHSRRLSAASFSPDGDDDDVDDSFYAFWKTTDSSSDEQQQPDFGRLGSNPKPGSSSANLYDSKELASILDLHVSLSKNKVFSAPSFSSSPAPELFSSSSSSSSFGLHDLVLQALEQQDQNDVDSSVVVKEEEENKTFSLVKTASEGGKGGVSVVSATAGCYNEIVDRLKDRIQNIRAIASDVDGTLLTSNHGMHPRTRSALLQAVACSESSKSPLEHFFVATGKSRLGAMTSLGPEVAQALSKTPGVFIQGLYCVDAAGQVVHEQKLSFSRHEPLIAATEQIVNEQGLTLLAYDGDVLYSTQASFDRNPHHWEQIHTVWREPRPILVETCRNFRSGFHKLILMSDTVEQIQVLRPSMEQLAHTWNASITVAVPFMLEVLPPGASKAVGVEKLCEHLGIDMSTQLLALGDGENDLEFLQKASIGIAMGNAVPIVQQAPGVDFVLTETNNDGGAGVAMELFGQLLEIVVDPEL